MIFNNIATPAALEAAILAANAAGGIDVHTIKLVSGATFTFFERYSGSSLKNALPVITANIAIIGNKTVLKRDDSAPSFRFFVVSVGAKLNLKGLILQNGFVDELDDGGAIVNEGGTLQVLSCSFIGNSTGTPTDADDDGGAIYNTIGGSVRGVTTCINCIFSENVGQNGGAVSNIFGTVNLLNCQFYDNKASQNGGAVYSHPDNNNKLTVKGCLLRDNEALNFGGAVAALGGKVNIESNDLHGHQAATGATLYCHGDHVTPFTIGDSIIKRNRIYANADVSVYNPSTSLDIKAKHNWWGAPDGPSGAGSGSGDSISLRVDYSDFVKSDEPSSDALCGCSAYAGKDCATGTNPISLRLGEKRLNFTDFSVQTPAGSLNFTRWYRQFKQTDPDFALMGLGWTHNHHYLLRDETVTATPPRLVFMTADGGSIFFDVQVSSTLYQAAAGSTSQIAIDSGSANARYVMTNADKSIYEFDDQTRLRKVKWPSNEYWIYRYYGDDLGEETHFALGELKEVIDDSYIIDDTTDPVTKRKLQFVYLEAPTFDDGGTPTPYAQPYLLWRVGDHTAANLVSGTPTGRYVELSYTPEVFEFEIVTDAKALLGSVSDVRDATRLWGYEYYQQSDANQKNWLTRRRTPPVDIDGDGTADDFLIPEDLTYTFHTFELAVNGDMEAETNTWTLVGSPSINERTTLQYDSPTHSRRVVANAVGQGIQGTQWQMVVGRHYTISAKVYVVNSGSATPQVKMQVTGTTAFDQTTSLNDNWETLTVTDYVATSTMDCRLQFVATALDGTGQIEFFVDTVSILETNPYPEITQKRGETSSFTGTLLQTTYEFAPLEDQTLETTQGVTTTHHFQWGLYQGATDALGNTSQQTADPQFRTLSQIDANNNVTVLDWSNDGKLLNGVTDAAGNQTQFTYNSDDTLAESIDAEGRHTQYFYTDSVNPRLPTQIYVIDANGSTILRSQAFTYDSKGRVICEKLLNPVFGNVLQKTTRTYHTDGYGNGLLKSVTQHDLKAATNPADCDEMPSGDSVTTLYTYDIAGRVIETKQTRLFGDCCGTQTEYDVAGNVTLTRNIRDWSVADNVKNPVTTYGYDEIGRRVRTTTNVGTSFEQTNLTLYDALNRVIRTISNFKDSTFTPYTAPLTWTWEATGHRWKDANGVTIDHGDENTQNIINITTYNARGSLRSQQDTLGNVTWYGYDGAGKLVKTIQSASQPNYDQITGGFDVSLNNYNPSDNPDQDIITTSFYDSVGNIIKTVSPLGNLLLNPTAEDQIGYVTLTGYDSLNRPVKVIRNASQPDYDMSVDPQLTAYVLSTDPDKDMVEATEYDALGRIFETRQLLDNRPTEQWIATRNVYDGLGRLVKVIGNYIPQGTTNPMNWIWEAANDRWEDGAGNAIDHGTNNDQNLITETTYDANGRMQTTRDLMGALSLPVFDGLNRQVKNVTQYINVPESTQPAQWIWSNSHNRWEYSPSNPTPVSFGTQNDQNVINETLYDGNGRVQQTRDVLGRVTYTVYDDVGRAFRTIGNYMAQGSSDPAAWIWDDINHRWEDGAGNPISFGTDNDQNIISEKTYDDRGRIQQTIDKRHNVTRYGYDELGRRIISVTNYVAQGTEPENWIWDDTSDYRWEDGAGNAIAFGADNDQNRIQTTSYDIAGRVVSSRDAAGIESIPCYDRLGRQLKSVTNYVAQGTSNPTDWVWDDTESRWEDGANNPISFGTNADQNRISETIYNKVGQVLTTRDARGTQSAFTYDKAGRRLSVAQAVGTGLLTTSYTCYDKAGRVLRTISNYIPLYLTTIDGVIRYDSTGGTPIAPDAQDGSGNWLFIPPHHGDYNDRNLISDFEYDRASRRIQMTDPAGNVTSTTYFRDGQVEGITDANGMVTKYRYDRLRRRFRVVQGYVPDGTSDPQNWVIVPGVLGSEEGSWKQNSGGATIQHGTNHDENIIVDVVYDPAGRVTSQFNPRAYETQYTYDALDRRLKLTNILTHEWATAYSDLAGGKTRTTLSYPGLSSGGSYNVHRDFDRLGRLTAIDYNAAATTPKVVMSYDADGNRSLMTENNGTTDIRKTHFGYDAAHRLSSVGFDNDGGGTIDETVSYQYDVRGLRTRLTLPGSLEIHYTYDAKGQLVSLTDWDSQKTTFAYDQAGRHIASERANRLRSRYAYDAAGRLRLLRHTKDLNTLAHFAFEVDGLGNRTQALEVLPKPTTGTTMIANTDASISYYGTWSAISGFKESSDFSASLSFLFFGSNNVTLKMGQGPDHSIYDVYIGGRLWQSFDGYAASGAETTISIPLQGDGPYLFEIRNRPEKRKISTGYKVRFKSLAVDTLYDLHTIEYEYDRLSRLLSADYYPGQNLAATPFRQYHYTFDRAGNRKQQMVTVAGTPSTTNYNYNEVNQLANTGYDYDNNGNLTSDGVNSYTWDRANRLTGWDNGVAADLTAYTYDGLGNRIAQSLGTISPTVTKYLLDLQPGLAVVLAETTGVNTTRNIHAPRGIHAHKDASGDWEWMMQDGLGSVRGVVDNSVGVLESRNYDPYGTGFDATGSSQTAYGFTGEPTDDNGLLYLRARYYDPAAGVFTALDPFEGVSARPMSLNGYSWVEGNVPNATDPSGKSMCGVPFLASYVLAQSGNNCPPQGTTACERLISEIRCAVQIYKASLAEQPLLSALIDEKGVFLDLMMQRFTGIPYTIKGVWSGNLRELFAIVKPPPDYELYPVPVPSSNDQWRSPIWYRSSQDAQGLQLSYGFRRPYYSNTHHYFFYLDLIYSFGPGVVGTINYERELIDLDKYLAEWKNHIGQPDEADFAKRYAWLYQEGINDLYITDQAAKVAEAIRTQDIDALPDLLGQDACIKGSNAADVWALQSTVDTYYFKLPEKYWPSPEFWPTSQ
jgi:RHS repeat-associated protein